MLLPRGTTGIHVRIEDDGSHRALAAELEALGYDTLWIAGGQLDRLSRATELLDATATSRVATGIVPLGRFDTAAVAEFTRTAGERFVLGLGGPQQARQLAALRGHLDALDRAGVGPDRRLLAALGPRKLRLAAERTSGAITLLTTPEYTATARAQVGPDAVLAVHEFAVLDADADADRARAAVREHAKFLAGVGGYRAALLRMGFTEADIDTLSDTLIDGVSAWGTAAEIADRVARHRAAGADHVNLSILGATEPSDVREVAARLAGELGLS
jgi:probable F420-dependent oxidoreductase